MHVKKFQCEKVLEIKNYELKHGKRVKSIKKDLQRKGSGLELVKYVENFELRSKLLKFLIKKFITFTFGVLRNKHKLLFLCCLKKLIFKILT